MITKKQKEVFDFIKNYVEKKKYAPSLDEIKTKFKLASVSTAHYYVSKLNKLGLLEKRLNQPRSIGVTVGDESSVDFYNQNNEVNSIAVPILGSANCGDATILAEENVEGYLKVSRNYLNKKDGVFALRVEGDSMNKASIDGKSLEEGNFVLIDSEYKNPKNGDYVLSVIDGCANLKKFEKNAKTGEIRLLSESENPKHKPIYVSSEDDFMINGRIIAVVKK